MPRNDTWCGRDAHQGLAAGLGPWRVGWSGPGPIGRGWLSPSGGAWPPTAGGSRRQGRLPVFAGSGGRRPRAMNAMTTLPSPLGTTIDVKAN